MNMILGKATCVPEKVIVQIPINVSLLRQNGIGIILENGRNGQNFATGVGKNRPKNKAFAKHTTLSKVCFIRRGQGFGKSDWKNFG